MKKALEIAKIKITKKKLPVEKILGTKEPKKQTKTVKK